MVTYRDSCDSSWELIGIYGVFFNYGDHGHYGDIDGDFITIAIGPGF